MFVLTSNSYDDIYQIMDKFMDDGYVVVYGAASKGEYVPSNKFVEHVHTRMSESGAIKDLEHRIEAGALRILDFREIYSEKNILNPDKLLEKWTNIIQGVRKNKIVKGLVVIAGAVESFTNSGSQKKLVTYEQSILKVITELGSIQVICCYMPESLKKLEFSSLISIAAAHQCVIADKIDFREISGLILQEAIHIGVEKVLGPGSAKLIFQTMKMIYRLDEDVIVSNPNVFEEKLRKVLGRSAEAVLRSVSEQVRRLL